MIYLVMRCRYLHEVCSPSVIHKNFKSANILLDNELNPHLSDCALASLVSEPDQVRSSFPLPFLPKLVRLNQEHLFNLLFLYSWQS